MVRITTFFMSIRGNLQVLIDYIILKVTISFMEAGYSLTMFRPFVR